MCARARQFARRHPQVGIRIAGRVGEGRFLQADLARALGQQRAERVLVAGQRFGDRDAGVVGGVDDDAVDADRPTFIAAVDRGEHGRAARRRPALAPGVLADDELVVELEPALFDLVEHVFERHQLGEARGRDKLIAVLFVQDAVAVGIEEERGGNVGVEGFVLLRRRRRRRRVRNGNQGGEQAGGDGGKRRRHRVRMSLPQNCRQGAPHMRSEKHAISTNLDDESWPQQGVRKATRRRRSTPGRPGSGRRKDQAQ